MMTHGQKVAVLAMTLGLFAFAGDPAFASPDLTFTVDQANSSASYRNLQCYNTDGSAGDNCTLAVQVVPYLAQTFSVPVGQSYEFGFFTVTVGGLGQGTADVDATLAFDHPPEIINGQASAIFFTLEGVFSEGVLTWSNLPQTVTLGDSESFTVNFTDIDTEGEGDQSGVDVIVTADTAVSEPTAVGVIGFGLVAFFAMRRFGSGGLGRGGSVV